MLEAHRDVYQFKTRNCDVNLFHFFYNYLLYHWRFHLKLDRYFNDPISIYNFFNFNFSDDFNWNFYYFLDDDLFFNYFLYLNYLFDFDFKWNLKDLRHFYLFDYINRNVLNCGYLVKNWDFYYVLSLHLDIHFSYLLYLDDLLYFNYLFNYSFFSLDI